MKTFYMMWKLNREGKSYLFGFLIPTDLDKHVGRIQTQYYGQKLKHFLFIALGLFCVHKSQR